MTREQFPHDIVALPWEWMERTWHRGIHLIGESAFCFNKDLPMLRCYCDDLHILHAGIPDRILKGPSMARPGMHSFLVKRKYSTNKIWVLTSNSWYSIHGSISRLHSKSHALDYLITAITSQKCSKKQKHHSSWDHCLTWATNKKN